MLCVAEAFDLNKTRASQHEDEGKGEIDNDIVREERDGDD